MLVVFTFIIAFIVYKFLLPKKDIVSNSPSSFLKKPTEEKLVISDVAVDNIYNNEIDINPRGDTLFSQTNDYQIIYFSQEKQFLISIVGSPFDQKRVLAEQEFLRILNINKSDACKLNTIINTPLFANPKESGTNYKLSFCD